MDTNTVNMISEKIDSAINALAPKLNVAAEHVYGTFLKQAYVDSITTLSMIGICSVILLILGGVLFWCLRKIIVYERKGENTPDCLDVITGVSGIPFAIILIITIIVFLSEANNIVTGFINPDYIAIETILRHIN